MKAMILAAGLGSRLKHKTAERPKALVEVNGKPIIQYQLENIIKADLDEVIIVVGYKKELIQDYVQKAFPALKVIFLENKEYDTTNSSYSFWQAKELLHGHSYMHFNCDIVFSFDLLLQVLNSEYRNAIAVRKDLVLGDKMENVVLHGDRIIKMSLKKTPEAVGKAFGLAKLSQESTGLIVKKLERYINNGDKNQNYFGMIREAVKELDYRAIITDKFNLQEINTLTDYDATKSILSENNFASQ